jgi:hypothetical protein
MEESVQSQGDQDQRRTAAARAMWEDLATRARALHCPDHYAQPWRVSVLGETPDTFRLYVSGCCPRLGDAVTEMIRQDPGRAATR